MKITTKTTLQEIREMLAEDGYSDLVDRAAEIKKAGLAGNLLWSPAQLVTTDNSHISARPEVAQ